MPVTRLMVVISTEIDGDAEAWLKRMNDADDERDELVDRALECVRRAVSARRVSSGDAALADPSLESCLAIRLGYGVGDELVEGSWADAVDLPPSAGRSSRSEALRPQERLSALLSGRTQPLACEELLVRARSDLDARRGRECALQLRVGLEAMLAERAAFTGAGQAEDVAYLDGRRAQTGEAANEALLGPLSGERLAEVAETLSACERVLRRRAAHG